MYGVHHAVAAKVTGGTLPDVLAVSFLPADKFPDRAARKADAVVLFEQVAPGKFERHTLATAIVRRGRVRGRRPVRDRPNRSGGRELQLADDSAHPVTIWKNRGKRR